MPSVAQVHSLLGFTDLEKLLQKNGNGVETGRNDRECGGRSLHRNVSMFKNENGRVEKTLFLFTKKRGSVIIKGRKRYLSLRFRVKSMCRESVKFERNFMEKGLITMENYFQPEIERASREQIRACLLYTSRCV